MLILPSPFIYQVQSSEKKIYNDIKISRKIMQLIIVFFIH